MLHTDSLRAARGDPRFSLGGPPQWGGPCGMGPGLKFQERFIRYLLCHRSLQIGMSINDRISTLGCRIVGEFGYGFMFRNSQISGAQADIGYFFAARL